MPVRKFRSLAEAEESLWLELGDPRIWDAAKARWAIHRALGAPSPPHPRGIVRYRSLEERQRDARDERGAHSRDHVPGAISRVPGSVGDLPRARAVPWLTVSTKVE